MNVQLKEDQINLIKYIAQKEGFDDFELETKHGSTKGDGSLGIIIAVTVKNVKRRLNLILKSAETNEKVRKCIPIRKAYLREIHLYEKIFPEFEKFQKEEGLKNAFSAFAKIYGSCDEENSEYLVLENMKELGYKMWNRKIPMNAEHVSLVISEYAKFHATSFAMSVKKSKKYKELTENLGNVFENTELNDGFISLIKSIIKNDFKPVKNNHIITEAFNKLFVITEKFLKEDLNLPEDQLVILHADCWSSNMLFQYKDVENLTKPTKVCLIDWQMSRVGSPILDLAYFFFVCSSRNVLRDHKTYLKLYQDTVCENLRKLSCDAENIFPSSLLQYHWKKFAKYGFYTAILTLKFALSEADEVAGISETIQSGNTLVDRLNFESIHINDYRQRILDIVSVMAENDLI